MKKILIPTDFSSLSDYALELAHKIAVHTNARILALHVVSVPAEALFNEKGDLIPNEDFDTSQLEQAKQEGVARIRQWAGKSKLEIQTAVRIGHFSDQVLRFINDEKIDLLVLGTLGAAGIKELIAGSMAEKLVKEAPIPILTLKCDRSDMQIRDIIFATDLAPVAEGKLQVIKDLQQAFGAKLHIVRINTGNDFVTSRELSRRKENFVKENGLKDAEFYIYCDDNVADGITHFAEDRGIDFIALGTNARSTLSRVIRKSVSKRLVNHAFHPVLTFDLKDQ